MYLSSAPEASEVDDDDDDDGTCSEDDDEDDELRGAGQGTGQFVSSRSARGGSNSPMLPGGNVCAITRGSVYAISYLSLRERMVLRLSLPQG